MKQYQAMTFVLTEDPDEVVLVTTHETSDDLSMTIHTAEVHGGFAIYITQEQAEKLTRKLQKGIINLEVEKRKREREIKDGI